MNLKSDISWPGMHMGVSLAILLLLVLTRCGSDELVHSAEEFAERIAAAQPGDNIVLANGVWQDFDMIAHAAGTADSPITIGVQEKGKVILSGQSYLQMSGEYLVVEGLVFKDGYTPTNEVIAMRTSSEDLCTNCRVTECVIDNYNNPERFESDLWVGIYGKNNRFDHNYLTGKRNRGVTVAVRLNSEESLQNNHRIEHNHFGYRPVLGSNGGESLRIGTSHYSLSNSHTLVENNFFRKCNGEHEIISNKSCQNTFRSNTFLECQGTLTMRHGNETLVEGNYFFGNGKPNTGGIRIINEKQRVIGNYCEGLTGYRFRGALVIMNGVPNSPLNRYFQVKESEASDNVFVDCAYIQFCAGSDEERSAVPVSTTVSNNLFLSKNRPELFTVYDDISGITFRNNVLYPGTHAPASTGFLSEEVSLQRNAHGLLLPEGSTFFPAAGERPNATNTGVSWYPSDHDEVYFEQGEKRTIEAGKHTLVDAVKASKPGDVILLEPGNYDLDKSIDLVHPVTIRAASQAKPVITFGKSSLFNIENGGSLKLENVVVDGGRCPDYSGNSVIRTSRYSMINNYKLLIHGCDFRDLDVNHSFNVLRVAKSTFADSVAFVQCTFEDVSGHVLELNQETEDIGIYNVENVLIDDCTFTNVGGMALDLYRGGRDESTFGPMLVLTNSSFSNVGYNSRNVQSAAIRLHGAQDILVDQCTFDHCKPLKLHLLVGDPVVNINNTEFTQTPPIESNNPAYSTTNVIYQ